jgi:outer membrane protein insertion porin family
MVHLYSDESIFFWAEEGFVVKLGFSLSGFCFWVLGVVWAQSHVSSLQISPPSSSLSSEMVKLLLLTQEKAVFEAEQWNEDLKRLYSFGLAHQLYFKSEFRPEGVFLEIQVEENPVLREIHWGGNLFFSSKVLQSCMQLQRGRYFSENLLFQDLRKIRDLYRKEGFFEVRVTAQKASSLKELDLTFQIQEGGRFSVPSVRFQGGQSFSPKTLSAFLQTAPHQGGGGWAVQPVVTQENLESDCFALISFYRSEGFLEVQVRVADFGEVEPSRSSGVFVERIPTFIILEGPCYRVRSLIFQGNTFVEESEFRANFRLKEKGAFLQRDFVQDLHWIYERYRASPYSHFEVETRTVYCAKEPVLDLYFCCSER